MATPDNLIGKGLTFPLNINEQGTAQLETGWPLIKSSVYNLLAFLIGERYFLGEFGASLEDMLEEPNDDISKTIIQYRLETQLPLFDPRILIDYLEIQREDGEVFILLSLKLKGTDITELFIIPATLNSVQ